MHSVRMIALVWSMAIAGTAEAQQPAPLPTLEIWHAGWCAPCRQLIADGKRDPLFVAALRSRYRIEWHDQDLEADEAHRRLIDPIPMFILHGQRISGYFGPQDLLERLSRIRPPEPEIPASSASGPNTSPSAPQATIISPIPEEMITSVNALLQQQREHESRSAESLQLLRQLDGRQQTLLHQVQQLPDLRTVDHSPVLQELQRLESTISQDLRVLGERPLVPSAIPPPEFPAGPQLPETFRDLLSRLPQLLPTLVGVAGLGATGGLSGLGVWLAGRMISRVITRPTSTTAGVPSPAGEQPCGRCPQLQAQIRDLENKLAQQRPDVQFTPYETSAFREAYTWARAECGKKYPGSIGTLETLDALIDQHLSSKRKPT